MCVVVTAFAVVIKNKMNKVHKINIARDFSRYPGCRYKNDCAYSGEEFRDDFLWPKLEAAINNRDIVEIDLDGVAGFSASFLDEAFAGLVRKGKISKKDFNHYIQFKCNDDPYCITEIKEYVNATDHK